MNPQIITMAYRGAALTHLEVASSRGGCYRVPSRLAARRMSVRRNQAKKCYHRAPRQAARPCSGPTQVDHQSAPGHGALTWRSAERRTVITGITEIAHITTKQDMSRWTRAHADRPGITWSVFAGPGGTM